MNKKQAFKYFGIIQKNEVWSWSGISDDRGLVALTIWTDQCKWIKEERKYVTSIFNMNNESPLKSSIKVNNISPYDVVINLVYAK